MLEWSMIYVRVLNAGEQEFFIKFDFNFMQWNILSILISFLALNGFWV